MPNNNIHECKQEVLKSTSHLLSLAMTGNDLSLLSSQHMSTISWSIIPRPGLKLLLEGALTKTNPPDGWILYSVGMVEGT